MKKHIKICIIFMIILNFLIFYTACTKSSLDKNTDANLKLLEIDGIEIKLSQNILQYDLNVENETNSIKINTVTNDEKAKVEIVGNSNLIVGKNEIFIVVTAEDEIITKTYTVIIHKKEELINSGNDENKTSEENLNKLYKVLQTLNLNYTDRDSEFNVTHSLELPTNIGEVEIKWESKNTYLLSNSGELKRPKNKDETIILNAILSYKNNILTKEFKMILKKELVITVDTKISNLIISSNKLNVDINSKYNLKAQVLYKNNTSSSKVKWISSNTDLAEINEEGDLSTNDKIGSLTISAISLEDNTFKAECKINIFKPIFILDGRVFANETMLIENIPNEIKKIKITEAIIPNKENISVIGNPVNVLIEDLTEEAEFLIKFKTDNINTEICYFDEELKKWEIQNNSYYKNGYMCTTVNHFSIYGLIEKSPELIAEDIRIIINKDQSKLIIPNKEGYLIELDSSNHTLIDSKGNITPKTNDINGNITLKIKRISDNVEVKSKINLIVPAASISKIINYETEEVFIGNKISLPNNIEVICNGFSGMREIKWEVPEFYAIELGDFIVKGEILGTDLKAEFKIKVLKSEIFIDKIMENNIIFVKYNEEYALPSSLKVLMSDKSEKILPVNWDIKKIDTLTPGEYKAIGIIDEYNLEFTLNIIVKNKPVSPEYFKDEVFTEKQYSRLIFPSEGAILTSSSLANYVSLNNGIKKSASGLDQYSSTISTPALTTISGVLDLTKNVYNTGVLRFEANNEVGIYVFINNELRDYLIDTNYVVEEFTANTVLAGINKIGNTTEIDLDLVSLNPLTDTEYPAEYLAVKEGTNVEIFKILSIDDANAKITVEGDASSFTAGTATVHSLYIETKVPDNSNNKINFTGLNYKLEQGSNDLALIIKDTVTNAYTYIGKNDSEPIDFIVDSQAPNFDVKLPINNGYCTYNSADNPTNIKLDFTSIDLSGDVSYIYGIISNDGTLTAGAIGIEANKVLDINNSHLSGTSLNISPASILKIKTDSADGSGDYLYLLSADDIDSENASGNIEMKKIIISEPISNPIDTSDGKLTIKTATGFYEAYSDEMIINNPNLEFKLISPETKGLVSVIKEVLVGSVVQKIVIGMTHASGSEIYSINFDLINDLGYSNLGAEKLITLKLEMTDSSKTVTEKIVKFKYINESKIITTILDSDLIFYSDSFTTATTEDVNDNNEEDTFYFNANPEIESIKIQNASYNYKLKIDGVEYNWDSLNNGFDISTAIELTANSPKKIIKVYLGNKLIKELNLILLQDYTANINIRSVKKIINGTINTIQVSGNVSNIPIEIFEKYNIQINFTNNSDEDSGYEKIPESSITYTSGNTINFDTILNFNPISSIGKEYDILEIKFYVENVNPVDFTIVPVSFDLDSDNSDDNLSTSEIKLSGLADDKDTWKLSNENSMLILDNNTAFTGGYSIYLNSAQVIGFTSGNTVDFTGKTTLKINGSITGELIELERIILITRSLNTEKPVFTLTPTNNMIYSSTNSFVISGEVTNASNVEIISFKYNGGPNDGNDVDWQTGGTITMPSITLVGDMFSTANLADDIDNDGVNIGTYTNYLANKGLIEGSGYTIILRATVDPDGIYVDYTYNCYYDTVAPTVNIIGTNVTDITTSDFNTSWTKLNLYFDSTGNLKTDASDILYAGTEIKSTGNDYTINTINGDYTFEIDETNSDVKKGFIALIQNQENYNDYLLINLPISEYDGDYNNTNGDAGDTDSKEDIIIMIEDENNNLLKQHKVSSTLTGKDRELFMDLGDNKYEKLNIYLQDNNGNKTEKYQINNTIYLNYEEPVIAVSIKEGSPSTPKVELTIDPILGLTGVDINIYHTTIDPVNSLASLTNEDLTTGKTILLSGDISAGDKIILLINAGDKYGNTVFKSIGNVEKEVLVSDELIPLLPQNVIVNNKNGIDTITGNILDYNNNGEIGITVVALETDGAGAVQNILGSTTSTIGGTFTLDILGDIINGDPTNTKIQLKVIDQYGNSSENSNILIQNKYLDITDKFASEYNYSVSGGTLSASSSGFGYKRSETITLNWSNIIETGTLIDDTTDLGQGNTIDYYEIRFKINGTEKYRIENIYGTTTTVLPEDLGDFNLSDVTIEIYGISLLGFYSNPQIITSVAMDSNLTDVSGIISGKIIASVLNDLITVPIDTLNLTTVGFGTGDKIFIYINDVNIGEYSTSIPLTYNIAINDLTVLNIKLKDYAGNESLELVLPVTDDESPDEANLVISNTVNGINYIYVDVSFTGEDNVTIIAKDAGANQIGQLKLTSAGTTGTIAINSNTKVGVKLYVQDEAGNESSGFVTIP